MKANNRSQSLRHWGARSPHGEQLGAPKRRADLSPNSFKGRMCMDRTNPKLGDCDRLFAFGIASPIAGCRYFVLMRVGLRDY